MARRATYYAVMNSDKHPIGVIEHVSSPRTFSEKLKGTIELFYGGSREFEVPELINPSESTEITVNDLDNGPVDLLLIEVELI